MRKVRDLCDFHRVLIGVARLAAIVHYRMDVHYKQSAMTVIMLYSDERYNTMQ